MNTFRRLLESQTHLSGNPVVQIENETAELDLDAGDLRSLEPQFRMTKREAIDEDARTVELSFSSEEPVMRWFGKEILDHSDGSIDLDRFNDSAQVLVNHDSDQVVGVVERAWVKGKRGHALIRFGESPFAEEIWNDVRTNIRRNVSVGYRISRIERVISDEDGPDEVFVREWLPLELSIVSVPADAGVGVGRSEGFPVAGLPKNHLRGCRSEVLVTRKENGEMPKTTDDDRRRDAQQTGTGNQDTRVEGTTPSPRVEQSQEQRGAGTPAEVTGGGTVVNADDVRRQERERVAGIQAVCEQARQYLDDSEVSRRAVQDGWTVDRYREDIWGRIMERSSTSQDGQHVRVAMPRTHLDLSNGDQRRYSLCRAIVASASNNWRGAEFEAECSQEVAQRIGENPNGFFVPWDIAIGRVALAGAELRAFIAAKQERVLTSGGAAAGAELVATDLMEAEFIDVLRPRLMINRLGARMLDGLVGNVDIPKQALAGSTGFIAEDALAPENELDTGLLQLSPKTLANHMKISRRLAIQSTPSAEALVRSDMLASVAEGVDLAGINGSGAANNPTGILSTVGIGDVNHGTNGGAPTWATMVELETDVAAANGDVGSLAYLTTPLARGKLKTTEKAANTAQYIWSSERDADGLGTMNGYRAAASTQVPANLTKGTGTNLSAAIFGNWSDLILAMWGTLDIVVDPFSDSQRGRINMTVFQDMDVGVRRAASFSAAQDIITT